MRKLLLSTISVAAMAAFSVPAFAQPGHHWGYRSADYPAHAVAPAAGVIGGTVFGLGVSEGWWGSSIAGVTLPTTVAGAAALGGVAGIGVAALTDAALEPCRGFAAMFNLSQGECVDGHYVGYTPRRSMRRHWRR